jgi:hypothetical protein
LALQGDAGHGIAVSDIPVDAGFGIALSDVPVDAGFGIAAGDVPVDADGRPRSGRGPDTIRPAVPLG